MLKQNEMAFVSVFCVLMKFVASFSSQLFNRRRDKTPRKEFKRLRKTSTYTDVRGFKNCRSFTILLLLIRQYSITIILSRLLLGFLLLINHMNANCVTVTTRAITCLLRTYIYTYIFIIFDRDNATYAFYKFCIHV